MKEIKLQSQTKSGEVLEAVFLPEQGMNLCSYKKGGIEVIDQSTRGLFEERFAGLGALIGPHFHRRPAESIPILHDDSIFPHIAKVRAKGVQDPFSHGIARYVPWQFDSALDQISARLNGNDLYKGVSIAALEGQQFAMTYIAKLTPEGLLIDYSVESEGPSMIGLHYYYGLNGHKGSVASSVQNRYSDRGELKQIPFQWLEGEHQLSFDLSQEADYGFYPFSNPLETEIFLHAHDYTLKVRYSCGNQENSWQLYHPKDSTFVCIEPLSAKDPRHPHQKASHLSVLISIIPEFGHVIS